MKRVCRLIKEGVKRDDASLPLLCEEKQRESWANRSGFSNFSSLTLIQKQFSAISWGTICNDTRFPLSLQSETAIPPTCHSKSSSHWRWGLCVSFLCVDTHTPLVCTSLATECQTRPAKKDQKMQKWGSTGLKVFFHVVTNHMNMTTLNDLCIDSDTSKLDLSWDEWNIWIFRLQKK